MNTVMLQRIKLPGSAVWFCIGSLLFAETPLSAQTSNDLYQQGRQFYEAGDYLRAVEYLFSCQAMAPSTFPLEFKRQLQDALAYAEEHVRVAIETKRQLDFHGKVTRITVQVSGKADDPSGWYGERSLPFHAPIDPARPRPGLPGNLPPSFPQCRSWLSAIAPSLPLQFLFIPATMACNPTTTMDKESHGDLIGWIPPAMAE